SIVDLSRVSDQTDNGRNINNTSPTFFHHALKDCARAAVSPGNIHLQYAVPVFLAHSHHQGVFGHSSVIDKNVNDTNLLLHSLKYLLNAVGICHLECKSKSAPTLFRQLLGN